MVEQESVVQVLPFLRARALADRAFDYLIPAGLHSQVRPGSVVRVSFARRSVRGLVVALGASGQVPKTRLLELEGLAEEALDPELLDLARFLADRYLAPLGACLQTVVPPYLAGGEAQPSERRIFWAVPVGERPANLALTAKQELLLDRLPSAGTRVPDLLRDSGLSRSVLLSLARKGAVRLEERDEEAPLWSPLVDPGAGEAKDLVPVLSAEQELALADLLQAFNSPHAERRLLWGVTGSGKTEVYLRLLKAALDRGAGAILLVPEIALTVQAIFRLRARLGSRVGVLHSGLSPGRRVAELRRVARGEVSVVVGARSAVFAPVRDLRLIILDEAHDSSYKQEEDPRYDAREAARWRIERAGGLLVEGTATPRLESLAGGAGVLELRSRPGGGRLPELEAIDLRRQGGRRLLAPRSREALRQVVARGEQAVILLNRRGYASYLHCDACGEVLMCPRCEVSLTYYRREAAVRCHHCGYSAAVPGTCPACRSASLSRGAPGTERLGDELKELVPQDRLFRLDSDVVTSTARVGEILAAFARSSPGVLLGTQMVAKGHDYPGVTLVVVADADTALYLPDFRAAERTFHLLTQVAGRAGRGERPGKVLVQTWNPDVACIRMALAHGEQEFYREELEARRRLGYPPFRDLVRVVVSARDETRAHSGADYLAERLRPHLGEAELRGPARLPALRRLSRWHLLLAGDDGARVRALLRRALESLREPYRRRGVDLMVDVDPQSFV